MFITDIRRFLIYCFMYLPLFAGFCVGLCFWYGLLYVLSSFVIILTKKRELFAFNVFLVLSYCKFHVGLPHDDVC